MHTGREVLAFRREFCGVCRRTSHLCLAIKWTILNNVYNDSSWRRRGRLNVFLLGVVYYNICHISGLGGRMSEFRPT